VPSVLSGFLLPGFLNTILMHSSSLPCMLCDLLVA
jgi:hypothetical protein